MKERDVWGVNGVRFGYHNGAEEDEVGKGGEVPAAAGKSATGEGCLQLQASGQRGRCACSFWQVDKGGEVPAVSGKWATWEGYLQLQADDDCSTPEQSHQTSRCSRHR